MIQLSKNEARLIHGAMGEAIDWLDSLIDAYGNKQNPYTRRCKSQIKQYQALRERLSKLMKEPK